jgi:hypothetical protein
MASSKFIKDIIMKAMRENRRKEFLGGRFKKQSQPPQGAQQHLYRSATARQQPDRQIMKALGSDASISARGPRGEIKSIYSTIPKGNEINPRKYGMNDLTPANPPVLMRLVKDMAAKKSRLARRKKAKEKAKQDKPKK